MAAQDEFKEISFVRMGQHSLIDLMVLFGAARLVVGSSLVSNLVHLQVHLINPDAVWRPCRHVPAARLNAYANVPVLEEQALSLDWIIRCSSKVRCKNHAHSVSGRTAKVAGSGV